MYQIAEPIITQRIGNLGLPVVDSFFFIAIIMKQISTRVRLEKEEALCRINPIVKKGQNLSLGDSRVETIQDGDQLVSTTETVDSFSTAETSMSQFWSLDQEHGETSQYLGSLLLCEPAELNS
jgi:hypothetical protein